MTTRPSRLVRSAVARVWLSVASAIVAASGVAAPTPVFAAPPSNEADQHFRRGVALYKENDFAAALVEFQRAYDVDPKYQVLFNIAESHYRLQDYAGALDAYQRYLNEGGRQIASKRRKDVEAEIATLSQRVATLTIKTSEPGATVTIDDVAVGTTPIEPRIVSAGRRKVTATLAGRTPVTTTIDLAGGDKRVVDLVIPAAPATPPPTEPPPPALVDEPSIVPPVVLWSVTGALAVGAVITGVVALGASSDLEGELARYPGDADALASAKSSAFGFGVATDVLAGTAIVAAGVSTYLTVDFILASDAATGGADGESPDAGTPEVEARVVVQPNGVTVRGTF